MCINVFLPFFTVYHHLYFYLSYVPYRLQVLLQPTDQAACVVLLKKSNLLQPPSIIFSPLIAPHRPQFNRAISSRGGPYAQQMCCFNQHWLLWLPFCCETRPPLFTSCAELSTWPCCAPSLGFTLERANQLALYATYQSRTEQQPWCQTPVTHTHFQYHWGL